MNMQAEREREREKESVTLPDCKSNILSGYKEKYRLAKILTSHLSKARNRRFHTGKHFRSVYIMLIFKTLSKNDRKKD